MIYRLFLQVLCVALIGVGSAKAAEDAIQPEISTGKTAQVSKAEGQDFMIVTANPLATKAGYDILKRGGSAADAAIAAQLVLGLVEPQSSGIGGGAFVMYYDAEKKELKSIDGRETAPGLAGPFLFYEDGKPMGFKEAILSGKSVGVPGVPQLLSHLHQVYGNVTWMELFAEARGLAQNGFEVSPRLAQMIEHHAEDLKYDAGSAAYFLDEDGKALAAGTILKNPAYDKTLGDMAFYGVPAFYEGDTASHIVSAVQNNPNGAGFMTASDLQGYELKERKPVCAPYRIYVVCSFGEPSSGALTMLQTLGMLKNYDLAEMGADNPKSWSVITQASALAFADRNKYIADPDFVNTPNFALLDPEYLAARAALINPDKPLETIEAGKPPLWDGPLYAKGNSIDKPGTSHISVIDKEGNILSMTTTIESAFGSHIMVDGFLLNNELTDFSFESIGEDGQLIANMVEGGKRPRSSMSPTIVFDLQGKPVLVVGSAGGSRIIGYVLQRIIATLDWGMDIDDALAMKHILARGQVIEMEDESAISKELSANGFNVKTGELNSGLTAIQIRGDTYIGAADPRREGTAMGH